MQFSPNKTIGASHYFRDEPIDDIRPGETIGEAFRRQTERKRAAAAKLTAPPAKPPGPPAIGTREWGKQLIATYGEQLGVEYMRREFSLAEAAADAKAERDADQRAEVARLKAERASLQAAVAKQERMAKGFSGHINVGGGFNVGRRPAG